MVRDLESVAGSETMAHDACPRNRHAFLPAVLAEKPLSVAVQQRVCLAAAALSRELGHKRKAAFYLMESARIYRENKQWKAAHEVRSPRAPLVVPTPASGLTTTMPLLTCGGGR